MPRLRTNKGFTLIEMVITVAVMAILVSLSLPAIFEYLRQRDYQREEIALGEIRKALQAYLAQTGTLPVEDVSGANAWYKQLAGYTSMAENEIANDVYGRMRTYVRYENTQRSMFGNPVSVFYATVHSMGVNGKAEDSYKNASGSDITISGMSVSGNAFDAANGGSSTWWKKQSGATAQAIADNVVTSFSGLRPGGDDHLMRFTNYSEVLDRYNLTIQRLDTLTEALETYSRSRYAERVSWCVANPANVNCTDGVPEKTIYYPRAIPSAANTEVVSGSSRNVLYDDTTAVVNNSSAVTSRRQDMEKLMDLLGLPRENCCSALTMGTDNLPQPFFYFSNPRPRSTSGTCGNRPQVTATSSDQRLPARVTTVNDSNTCG